MPPGYETRCENKMFMYRRVAKPISFFLRCGLKAGLDTMKFLYDWATLADCCPFDMNDEYFFLQLGTLKLLVMVV